MDRHSEKKKVDILEAMLKLFTKKNKKTLHVPEVRLELYYTEDAQDFRCDSWKDCIDLFLVFLLTNSYFEIENRNLNFRLLIG